MPIQASCRPFSLIAAYFSIRIHSEYVGSVIPVASLVSPDSNTRVSVELALKHWDSLTRIQYETFSPHEVREGGREGGREGEGGEKSETSVTGKT